MRVAPALMQRSLSVPAEGAGDGERVLSANTEIKAEVTPVMDARSSVHSAGRLEWRTSASRRGARGMATHLANTGFPASVNT